MLCLKLGVFMTLGITATAASGSVQVYYSQSQWAAVVQNPTMLTDFEEGFWARNVGLTGPQSHPGFTIEGFAGVPGPNIVIGVYGPPGAPTNVCVANGDENIDVTPQNARTAFAYDIFINELGPTTITAFDGGGGTLGSVQVQPGYIGFFGLTSPTPIARVKFVSTQGAVVDAGFDNVRTADRVPPPCPGDFNNDRQVNTSDLIMLLSRFGQNVPPGSVGDLNGDGTVSTLDLTIFLGRFGVECP